MTFVFSFLVSRTGDEPFVDWSFEAALAAAKREKKLLVIEFFADRDDAETMALERIWRDEKVRSWLRENAISLKVDANLKQPLAAKLKVFLYPRILFLNENGTIISRLWARQADQFLVAGAR